MPGEKKTHILSPIAAHKGLFQKVTDDKSLDDIRNIITDLYKLNILEERTPQIMLDLLNKVNELKLSTNSFYCKQLNQRREVLAQLYALNFRDEIKSPAHKQEKAVLKEIKNVRNEAQKRQFIENMRKSLIEELFFFLPAKESENVRKSLSPSPRPLNKSLKQSGA